MFKSSVQEYIDSDNSFTGVLSNRSIISGKVSVKF